MRHFKLLRFGIPVLVLTLCASSGWAAPAASSQLRVNIAWQVALDGADFSPGIIDGQWGPRGQRALDEYTAAHFPDKHPTAQEVFDALGVSVDDATRDYVITAEDAGLVTGPAPEGWLAKSQVPVLGYETLAECIAEKFHCTRGLLERLNTGVDIKTLAVGQTVTVPNVRRPFELARVAAASTQPAPRAAQLSIDLTQRTIRAFDRDGHEIALFNCSVARDKAKLPARDAVIKKMAVNPEYQFDPKMWTEVKDVSTILRIPPGPHNPVGIVWMGLDLPGYGIHGTPNPELIGRTGSHGCFRMTNWDARRLYDMVSTGMTVKMINPEKVTPKDEGG